MINFAGKFLRVLVLGAVLIVPFSVVADEAGLLEKAATAYTSAGTLDGNDAKEKLIEARQVLKELIETYPGSVFAKTLAEGGELEVADGNILSLDIIQQDLCAIDGFDCVIRMAIDESHELKGDLYKVRGLVGIVKLQEKAGQLDSAAETLEDIEGIVSAMPAGMSKLEALDYTAEAYALVGKKEALSRILDDATEIQGRVSNDIERSAALNYIVSIQVEAGQLNEALSTSEQISNGRFKLYALYSIGKGLVEAGRLSDAFSAVARMPDDLKQLKYDAFMRVAKAQAEAGQVAEAFSTAEAISDDAVKSYVFTVIALAQAEAGGEGAVDTAFSNAEKAAQAIADGKDKSSMLAVIAKAQAEAGREDAADATFAAAAQSIDAIGNDESRLSSLLELAKAQAEAGREEAADATFAAASEVAYSLEDGYGKLDSFSALAIAQAMVGRENAANEALAEAEKVAQRVTYINFSPSQVLVAIATAQAEKGQKDAVSTTSSSVIAMAKSIADDSTRNSILLDVSEVQAKVGLLGEALSTVQMMDISEAKFHALSRVAETLLDQPQ
ncbi:hypothetical protein [Halomonas binhaiensis]|uniref:Tetratricopeptide repeat protein n=1 Tax=Halomonas binhaiensis TaxID=2562282 RepID=A0A5C1NHK2_9GAMM|nr:hypothetical protein [Halomonas binhaiensis]QEM83152.1 hypothetical protein E4T21_17580 [Halomonas binhaiensis]